VRRHLARWDHLQAGAIRARTRAACSASIQAPILANQVLAAGGAIFAWAMREEVGGVTVNPFRGIGPIPPSSASAC
jgi:hypothetical protein